MRIVFPSKEKETRCADAIYRLGECALQNDNFALFEESTDLMFEVCGMRGLEYCAYMSKIRLDYLTQLLSEKGAEE